MKQESSEIGNSSDVKKLSFVVVFLSIFVVTLFGLIPLV